jgi:GNAT superfamily N-acetyltransferase
MEQLIAVRTPGEQEQWNREAGLPPFDSGDLVRHAPDAHWNMVSSDGETVGRCSLWWRHAPSLPGHRLGIIGHYAVRDAAAARGLLQHACEQLAARGCTMAVGPMDGNTWRRYRLITDHGTEPVFFLEPDNPDDWPAHFTDSGFTALAHYTSAIDTCLGDPYPGADKVGARAAARGIRIRSIRLDRFEDELRHLYAVASVSFRDNFLYSPLGEAEFIAQYRRLQPYILPELVFIAEQGSRPIGFNFAIPDLLQATPSPDPDRRDGQAIGAIIFKTIAVHPAHRAAGLGSLLVARFREAARNLGYRRVIHALMHETNDSRKISERCEGRTIRRYVLFGRRLSSSLEAP